MLYFYKILIQKNPDINELSLNLYEIAELRCPNPFLNFSNNLNKYFHE